MYGDGMLVFCGEYSFGSGECRYGGIGFICWTILENIFSVAKGIVHGVGVTSNVVMELL